MSQNYFQMSSIQPDPGTKTNFLNSKKGSYASKNLRNRCRQMGNNLNLSTGHMSPSVILLLPESSAQAKRLVN